MWTIIKKTVNSKLKKAIDQIIIDKVNKSYNKGACVPLNKMLKGEELLLPDSNEKTLLIKDNWSIQASNQSSTPVTIVLDENFITGVYSLYGTFGNINNPSYTQTYYITIDINDNKVKNNTVTVNSPVLSPIKQNITDLILHKNDKLTITITKRGSGNHIVTDLYLGASKKQVPLINIVDKTKGV